MRSKFDLSGLSDFVVPALAAFALFAFVMGVFQEARLSKECRALGGTPIDRGITSSIPTCIKATELSKEQP